ncbi:MAG: hypothetical protein OXE98_02485, partial [Hyphomicrobiales bacterium]|nr:hypothetical protein [Hyphomicrobiales bacterium]
MHDKDRPIHTKPLKAFLGTNFSAVIGNFGVMTSLHQNGANGGKNLYIYVKNRKTAINPPRMA